MTTNDYIYDVATVRVTKKIRDQLKRFGNFLSDRKGGQFISQKDALQYLLNRLEKKDLEEYQQWLFSDNIQFRSRDEILEELQQEREMGEAILSSLCGSCQKHVGEMVEAME